MIVIERVNLTNKTPKSKHTRKTHYKNGVDASHVKSFDAFNVGYHLGIKSITASDKITFKEYVDDFKSGFVQAVGHKYRFRIAVIAKILQISGPTIKKILDRK